MAPAMHGAGAMMGESVEDDDPKKPRPVVVPKKRGTPEDPERERHRHLT